MKSLLPIKFWPALCSDTRETLGSTVAFGSRETSRSTEAFGSRETLGSASNLSDSTSDAAVAMVAGLFFWAVICRTTKTNVTSIPKITNATIPAAV